MMPLGDGIGPLQVVMPIVVGLVFVLLMSRLREPQRQNANAVIVGGAGAAYLNGGFGAWEFAYMVVATVVAYHGLRAYGFIGFAWLMHTGWDVLHHLYGTPIVPFAALSSFGCAICDLVIAAWCFAGAPRPGWAPTSSKVQGS